MSQESGNNIYSRNIRSVISADLVPAYMILRNEYDPIPFKQDIMSFSRGLDWLSDKPNSLRDLECLGQHMATLSIIAEYAEGIENVDNTRRVAFMPGSENWENDVLSSARSVYAHMLVGEGKIENADYFTGEIEATSTSNSIEIVHQYLERARDGKLEKLLWERTDSNWRVEIGLIIKAKDLLIRGLFQSYFEIVRSRAHKE